MVTDFFYKKGKLYANNNLILKFKNSSFNSKRCKNELQEKQDESTTVKG